MYLGIYIYPLARGHGHTYIPYTRVHSPISRVYRARGYRRGRIENWKGWRLSLSFSLSRALLSLSPRRKVVGGNKALGTALLRPLIWRARRHVYVCTRDPGNTGIYPLNSRSRRASRERRCIHNDAFSSPRNYE